jgi:hypothetical protein
VSKGETIVNLKLVQYYCSMIYQDFLIKRLNLTFPNRFHSRTTRSAGFCDLRYTSSPHTSQLMAVSSFPILRAIAEDFEFSSHMYCIVCNVYVLELAARKTTVAPIMK